MTRPRVRGRRLRGRRQPEGLHRADQPEDHEAWAVIVEVEAHEPNDAAVVRFVTDLMRVLRSHGHRVVAACDFADRLPRR